MRLDSDSETVCGNVECGNKVRQVLARKGWSKFDDKNKRTTNVPLCNACGLLYTKGSYCIHCMQIYRVSDIWDMEETALRAKWHLCLRCGFHSHVSCKKKFREEETGGSDMCLTCRMGKKWESKSTGKKKHTNYKNIYRGVFYMVRPKLQKNGRKDIERRSRRRYNKRSNEICSQDKTTKRILSIPQDSKTDRVKVKKSFFGEGKIGKTNRLPRWYVEKFPAKMRWKLANSNV